MKHASEKDLVLVGRSAGQDVSNHRQNSVLVRLYLALALVQVAASRGHGIIA